MNGPRITAEQLNALANLAGSFLMVVAFLLLVAGTVLLYMVWRGLKMARAEIHVIAPLLLDRARRTQGSIVARSDAVTTPQIRILSGWAGARAGLRALFTGRPALPDVPEPGGAPGAGGAPPGDAGPRAL